MIEWLDMHQGSVMACLTAVYVIATIWLALLMKRSNRVAANALDRSIQYQKETTRPYVIFDVEVEDRMVNGVLKNIGQRPAINVLLTSDPPLKHQTHSELPCLFSIEPVPFLPPGRAIKDFLGGQGFLNSAGETTFNLTLTYSDLEQRQYTETTKTNFFMYSEQFVPDYLNKNRTP